MWCMGVAVKADRTRIMIILMLSLLPTNHINVSDTVLLFYTAFLQPVLFHLIIFISILPVSWWAVLNFESVIHGHHFFICQTLNQLRNIYVYSNVGVVSDTPFHSVNAMLLPENCVNLGKIIIEAENVNS